MIPFTLGLIELVVLWNLMITSEQQALREQHAKEVVATANDLSLSLLESARALSAYVVTKDRTGRGHLNAVVADMGKQSDRLSDLVQNDPHQAEIAKQIQSMQSRVASILRLLADLADRQREFVSRQKEMLGEQPLADDLSAAPVPLLSSLVRDIPRLYGLRKQLNLLFIELLSQLNTLKEEVTRQPLGLQTEEYWRHVIKNVLIAGVIINFMSTIAIGLFFTKSITTRLRVTMDNTANLADDRPLLPAIKGSDEIAHLDHAFHKMADSIKQAESLLRESEERFRLITEYLPIGVAILDSNGKIELVNDSFEKIFEQQSTELLGIQVESLFRKGSDDKVRDFARLKESAFGNTLELAGLRKGGKEFPADVLLTSFSIQGLGKYLVIITDQTHKHEIERLKREFIAMVSHDLRTPLTLIMNNLAFLEQESSLRLSDQARKILHCSEEEGRRLIKLVNDLLDLEKMESGKFELQYEQLDVAELFEQAASGVKRFADTRNLKIEVADVDVDLTADGARLLQVLNNLLSNAIKFSPDGGTIRLSAEAGQQHLKVQVSDEGRGIPEAKQNHIFERFSQIELSDSKDKGGSGLGLAICRAIVEQHAGTIGVDSQEGKGSTFWFRIPSNS
ncbi:MAG: hypothetical protein C5B53_06200 [Candidatus Melainabacteria bacterium]|nr:MAG: hypothetical protein C5B53_06200 [Candidatus Melainabacteria bacterium]